MAEDIYDVIKRVSDQHNEALRNEHGYTLATLDDIRALLLSLQDAYGTFQNMVASLPDREPRDLTEYAYLNGCKAMTAYAQGWLNRHTKAGNNG